MHPSYVSGCCYHISVSLFLFLHCQRLAFVTESVTKPGYSLEDAHHSTSFRMAQEAVVQ